MAGLQGSIVKGKQVQFPAICVVAPGHDPTLIDPVPVVMKLDFMFAKKTDEELTEEYGKVDRAMKAMEKWAETAKGILKERLPEPQIDVPTGFVGSKYRVEYTKTPRTALSNELVKLFAGDKYAELCVTTYVFTLKVKDVTGV